MNNEVRVEGVFKNYGEVEALQDISLDIHSGELFGLIGPDGAGKSSLFRILTTLLLADKGKATVCSLDVVRDYKKIRTMVGYMPGRFSLYQDLTVEENLNFFATVFNTTVEENYGTGYLCADRAVQETESGKAVGRYEAETGVKLCPDPSSGSTLSG